MQEELENRVVVMIESSAKLTAALLKKALIAFLENEKRRKALKEQNQGKQEKKPAEQETHGEMSVEDLAKQGKSLQSIPVNADTIGDFSHYARKFGVDYAPFKVDGEDKYLVFFKGADRDAITAAFTAYTSKQLDRANTSVIDELKEIKDHMKAPKQDRVRKKVPER